MAEAEDSNVGRGSLWICSGSALLAIAFYFVQAQLAHLPVIVLTLLFYGAGLVILSPFALRQRLVGEKRPHAPIRLQVYRAVASYAHFLLFFYALRSESLEEAVLLRTAAPLWVPILSALFLHKQVPGRVYALAALGFSGVVLVLQPGGGAMSAGLFLAVLAGVAYAVQIILTRELSEVSEPALRTMLFAFSFAVLLSFIPALSFWQAPTLQSVGVISVAGAGTALATILLVEGYRFAAAYLLAPFLFTAVVVSALIGWLVAGHVPDTETFLGFAVIATACVLLARQGRSPA